MQGTKTERRSVLDAQDGYEIKQYFNENHGRGRWYVYLPANSKLRKRFKKNSDGRMLRAHYTYCMANNLDGIPKDHVIHHIDSDRENDNIENLQLLSHGDHNALHADDVNKPGSFKGRRHTAETRRRMREIARTNGYNGQWGGPKKNHFPETIEKMSASASGKANSQYRHDIPTEGIRRAYAKLKDLTAVSQIFGCSVQAVRNRIKVTESVSIDWMKISDQELLKMLEECGGVQSRLALKIQAPGTSLFRRLKKVARE